MPTPKGFKTVEILRVILLDEYECLFLQNIFSGQITKMYFPFTKTYQKNTESVGC